MTAPPRSCLTDRTKQIALVLFFTLTAISCINVDNAEYFTLQHVPTTIAILLLYFLDLKWPLDHVAFFSALAILVLHVIGARYLYSFVPYDEWGQSLFGVSIQDYFGWERNHYDRLVHFSYGVLMGLVLVRWLPMYFLNRRRWAGILALDFVLSTSALYELLEWGIGVLMAPDWAESFNGQQGDVWDAHKDMALALLGATLSATVSFPWWGRRVAAPVEDRAQISENDSREINSGN